MYNENGGKNMNANLPIFILNLCFLLLTVIMFSTKNKYKTIENKIYSLLLGISFLGIIIDIFTLLNYQFKSYYYIYIITFLTTMTVYGMLIKQEKEVIIFDKKQILNNRTIIKIMLTYLLLIIVGFFVNDIHIIIFLFFTIWIFIMQLKRKYVYFILLIILYIPIITIEQVYQLTLVSALINFIIIGMYNNLYNPDINLINKLNIATDNAIKAEKVKQEFLSSMSHEIRTPLNSINGFYECIKNSCTLNDAENNIDDILKSCNNLLEVVNGILDISKMESGKLDINESDYNFRKLINSVTSLYNKMISEKFLDFDINIDDSVPSTLYGDSVNIKKIISNLLSNAVKYTDDGYIRLGITSVQRDNVCKIIITVKDSGRGIKNQDLENIFYKFDRLDSKDSNISGTGLGLPIIKYLAEEMNGSVTVHSVVAKGSEFTVIVEQKISDKKLEESFIIDYLEKLDLTNKKVLIVDDNLINIKVATKHLSIYNMEISSCISGKECLELTKTNTYDLILMDDMMPELRGPEVLKILKENKKFNTPVIALTANVLDGVKEQYLKDGFVEYLPKPINKTQLHNVLNKVLK